MNEQNKSAVQEAEQLEPMPEFRILHGNQVAPELPVSRAWREALARKQAAANRETN